MGGTARTTGCSRDWSHVATNQMNDPSINDMNSAIIKSVRFILIPTWDGLCQAHWPGERR